MKAKKIKFYLVKLLITSFAVLFTAWMLQKGIHIEEPRILTAIIVGVTLILLNTFLKPLLIRLTIPLTVFSFGFFLLVINAIVIELIDFMLPGFTVDSFFGRCCMRHRFFYYLFDRTFQQCENRTLSPTRYVS